MMTDYTIVIPSYKRQKILQEKTLTTLKKYKIPKESIYVFVANQEEYDIYKEFLDPSTYGHLVVGVPGLAHVRNFISNYFPKGKKLVSCDDDIRGFIEFDATMKRKEKELVSLKKLIERGFKECKEKDANLWGLYPSANGFFMKDTVSYDLKFIIGNFFGYTNFKNERQLTVTSGPKDDYERSLLFFKEDGVVVRLNFAAAKTSIYTTPGGLQDGKRLTRVRKDVQGLLKKYPEYVVPNPRRKGPFPEILLRNKTRKNDKEPK
jgi:hypothetical protein